MQITKIYRAEKKGIGSVMDEKFALIFTSTFQMADVQINVWVMSLPIAVTVHGNQKPQSWATITWDNAFSEISRFPFIVVDHVSWSRMAITLNTKFTSLTGRGLTHDNLLYLCKYLYFKHGESLTFHNVYLKFILFLLRTQMRRRSVHRHHSMQTKV